MSNLLKKGNTISFIYDGGSTPGRRRTVTIENVDNAHIGGTDVDKGEYRQFTRNFMRVVRLATVDFETERQDIEDLLKRHPSYLNLVTDFNQKYGVEYEFKDRKLQEKQDKVIGNALLNLTKKILTVTINGHTFEISMKGMKVDNKAEFWTNQVVDNLIK